VLDAGDRPVRRLEVEAPVHGHDPLGLGVNAVDGHMEVVVVRVAMEGVERLVIREAHLAEKDPHGAIGLDGCRLLALPPAQDPVLHRLG
jgi:hypothetical protein